MYCFIFILCLNTRTSRINTNPFFDLIDFQVAVERRVKFMRAPRHRSMSFTATKVCMRRMGPRGMWNGIGWGCPRHRPRRNAFWSNAVATVNAVNMANAIAWKVGWGTRAKH
jgi:hypothetical protein